MTRAERTTAPLDGRYELIERIGRGGFGEVFRARDRAMEGREVCIKRLTRASDEQVQSLLDEAHVLARVRHANVVALFAVGAGGSGFEREAGGRDPFLVLELVRGPDLRSLTDGLASRLPDRVAVHVACCVLRALGAAARAAPGLVHRDVTPHNVLVSREGEVKLADFGIALVRGSPRRTGPSLVKGKLGYLSPEQVAGADLDARSDLFATGVLLYELLAGARPWGPRKGMPELARIMRGDAAPITARRPRLDRHLAACVHRLLAHDPARRPACADDALRELAPHGAGELGSLRLASLVATLELGEPGRERGATGDTTSARAEHGRRGRMDASDAAPARPDPSREATRRVTPARADRTKNAPREGPTDGSVSHMDPHST